MHAGKFEVGTKIKDVVPYPANLDATLASKGYAVGDLVEHRTISYSNLMFYRIIQDVPPMKEAYVGEYKMYRNSTYKVKGWMHPATSKPLKHGYVYGHVVLEPVFRMDTVGRCNKKRVAYTEMWRLKKVDILELGKMFSKLNDFVMSEARRLKGE